MDDDSLIDFDLLDNLLDASSDAIESVSCPSVWRNVKPWRHSESNIFGKYAISVEDLPENYNDFCWGSLYTSSLKGALGLAVIAQDVGNVVSPDKIIFEDLLITGLLRKRLPWLHLRSLTPIGGKTWDGLLSHCPFLSFLRMTFNPLILNAGSADNENLQYVWSIRFVLCVFAEYVIFEYLPSLGSVFKSQLEHCKR